MVYTEDARRPSLSDLAPPGAVAREVVGVLRVADEDLGDAAVADRPITAEGRTAIHLHGTLCRSYGGSL